MTIGPLVSLPVICVTIVAAVVGVKAMRMMFGSHPTRDRLARLAWRKDWQIGFEGFHAGERWRGKEAGVRSE